MDGENQNTNKESQVSQPSVNNVPSVSTPQVDPYQQLLELENRVNIGAKGSEYENLATQINQQNVRLQKLNDTLLENKNGSQ